MQSFGEFKWQRRYLDDLIKAKKVQLRLDDQDGIQEVQSVEQIHAARSSVAVGPLGNGFVKSNKLETKVDRITQAVIFCGVFALALVAM